MEPKIGRKFQEFFIFKIIPKTKNLEQLNSAGNNGIAI